jgi:hypothetical protein
MKYNNLKKIAVILIFAAVCLFLSYFVVMFINLDTKQKEPIRTIFLSKSKEVKPSMRKVLQMDNIRVYQYTDSIGTYTIFASEFDFLSNTSNQLK